MVNAFIQTIYLLISQMGCKMTKRGKSGGERIWDARCYCRFLWRCRGPISETPRKGGAHLMTQWSDYAYPHSRCQESADCTIISYTLNKVPPTVRKLLSCLCSWTWTLEPYGLETKLSILGVRHFQFCCKMLYFANSSAYPYETQYMLLGLCTEGTQKVSEQRYLLYNKHFWKC